MAGLSTFCLKKCRHLPPVVLKHGASLFPTAEGLYPHLLSQNASQVSTFLSQNASHLSLPHTPHLMGSASIFYIKTRRKFKHLLSKTSWRNLSLSTPDRLCLFWLLDQEEELGSKGRHGHGRPSARFNPLQHRVRHRSRRPQVPNRPRLWVCVHGWSVSVCACVEVGVWGGCVEVGVGVWGLEAEEMRRRRVRVVGGGGGDLTLNVKSGPCVRR